MEQPEAWRSQVYFCKVPRPLIRTMEQPEAWRSQVAFSSLDSNFSYDSDMPETDSQSSQEMTDSQSSQEETVSQSSQMETDRQSPGMNDSPEIKASQAISVPVSPKTVISRRISTSLEDNVKHGKPMPCFCNQLDDNMKHGKPFYFYKQHIGSETSTREFKQGLGEFKGNLRKYATAFLNNEGGMLMIGVDDSGRVLGNNIDFHQQDNYRRMADIVFQNFKPPVWSRRNYNLEFVPVELGVEEIPPGETPDFKDLMVLRISFERPAGCRKLYRTDQEKVYIRHDGSVQQMTPDKIHDWYEGKWKEEMEQLAKEIDELRRDKVKQLAKENDELRRDKVKQLAKENDELRRDKVKQQTKQNRSPIHQKRKMTAPASEEADKKSPRLRTNGSMASPVMKENEDDEDLKTWNEEDGQKRRSRKQIPQDRHPLRPLASGNAVMEEKSASGNGGRLMKEKRGRIQIQILRSSVGERGAENSSAGRPQRKGD